MSKLEYEFSDRNLTAERLLSLIEEFKKDVQTLLRNNFVKKVVKEESFLPPLAVTFFVEAHFTGADGSSGYKHGMCYKLQVVQLSQSLLVHGLSRYGVPCSPEVETVEYESLRAFLRNWHDVNLTA